MRNLGARLRRWSTRPKKPQPEPEPKPDIEPESQHETESPLRPEPSLTTDKIGRRISRVAESILDNEALTSGLDDWAAKGLLDWGLAVARQIVQGTAGVDDDEQAEQAMYPRLRATRRLMRAVNRWIASWRDGDVESQKEAFNSVLEQASIIYGRPITATGGDQPVSFSVAQSQYARDPSQMIAHLRQLVEGSEVIPDHSKGEK